MTDRSTAPIPTRRPHRLTAPAFTLVELLVVIGIIVLLISILLPAVSHVRTAAQAAATKNFINQLSGAIERYQQDFRAYPGPLSNNEIRDPNNSTSPVPNGSVAVPSGVTGFDVTTQSFAQMYSKSTMSENLVLGLLGGLRYSSASSALVYDPSAVGGGPSSLNTVGLPKKYAPYIDAQQLSWRTGPNGKTGKYQDDDASADDSIIPEFEDSFPDPMPIIYMRAKVGAVASLNGSPPSAYKDSYNPIITDDLLETATDTVNAPAPRAGQYDLSQFYGYTAQNQTTTTSIGVGKKISKSAYVNFIPAPGADLPHGLQSVDPNATMTSKYPYDAYPYLISSSGSVRQKDGYILISAGVDRVYGTKDDICNFGDVGQ